MANGSLKIRNHCDTVGVTFCSIFEFKSPFRKTVGLALNSFVGL